MILFKKGVDINTAYSRFSFNLFDAISAQQPDKNILVSPVSVALVLAMCCNGAQGTTQQAILKVLESASLSLSELNTLNSILLEVLQQVDAQIHLSLKNSLSVNAPVDPSFLKICENIYKVQVYQDAPPGMITLKNEIDFKGVWTDPFEPSTTRNELFTLANGNKKRCRMMYSIMQYWSYYENDRFQLVRLPYGKRRISLYVLLPAENVPLSEVMNEFSIDSWKNRTVSMKRTEGTIQLPRFEADYHISLKSILAGMGVSIAFEPDQANFGAMFPLPAYIESIEQRARIKVHEEGTEAYAETTGDIPAFLRRRGRPVKITFRMWVKRPCLYLIQDDKTQLPLFMGILADPAPLENIVDSPV